MTLCNNLFLNFFIGRLLFYVHIANKSHKKAKINKGVQTKRMGEKGQEVENKKMTHMSIIKKNKTGNNKTKKPKQ